MNVQLLAHTPAPEQLVAASAKLCYSAASIADLAAIEADKAAEFIGKLPEAHQSPFEHVSFTFGIEGVSRAMLLFFSLRCCKRAQWEIRAVANEMLRLCKEVAPEIFAKAGPGCVRGHCPEGKMGCKGCQ